MSVMPAVMAPSVHINENGASFVREVAVPAPIEEKVVKSEDYMPITDSKNVEMFINDYFNDIPIMSMIAKCESRYRQFNSRGEILKGEQNSYDRGVMQINLLYHGNTAEKLGLDVHNIDDNVAYARYLYEKQGTKPWNSSSKCWGRYVGSELALK
jgi:hypothetical protein